MNRLTDSASLCGSHPEKKVLIEAIVRALLKQHDEPAARENGGAMGVCAVLQVAGDRKRAMGSCAVHRVGNREFNAFVREVDEKRRYAVIVALS